MAPIKGVPEICDKNEALFYVLMIIPFSRPHEVSMDMTRVVRPDLTSERANDKTMLALDEGMEMTVAIPSKKLAQNKTAADAPSDSDFLSMESTRIHRDETDKRCTRYKFCS